MFEYIFFADEPRDRFIAHLEEKGVAIELADKGEERLVKIDEDIDDALLEDIDDFYDAMMEWNEALVAEAEGEAHRHAAGITITLKDGSSVQVAVEPAFLNRLLSAISIEELGQFVHRIADAVENPDDTPFCQKVP
ncbi:MAG TPA: hypothetical protein EYP40_08035 [Chromatiales bacterium]|nr:hypothetical protein [Chromatiales bacterium]